MHLERKSQIIIARCDGCPNFASAKAKNANLAKTKKRSITGK
jgi:hypothetical protein